MGVGDWVPWACQRVRILHRFAYVKVDRPLGILVGAIMSLELLR